MPEYSEAEIELIRQEAWESGYEAGYDAGFDVGSEWES